MLSTSSKFLDTFSSWRRSKVDKKAKLFECPSRCGEDSVLSVSGATMSIRPAESEVVALFKVFDIKKQKKI